MKSGNQQTILGVVLGSIAVFALLVVSATGLVHIATAAKSPPNLAGLWRLDPEKSETPGAQGGHGGWGGGGGGSGGGGGGWGGHHHGGMGGGGGGGGMGGGWGHHGGGDHEGMGGGPPDSARMGGAMARRLPDLIRIEQTATSVSIGDSAGTALLQVTTPASSNDTVPATAADQVQGKWDGVKLEYKRPGPNGHDITQRVYLEDKGRTLVLETKIPANGERPGRDFKRVYRKEGTS